MKKFYPYPWMILLWKVSSSVWALYSFIAFNEGGGSYVTSTMQKSLGSDGNGFLWHAKIILKMWPLFDTLPEQSTTGPSLSASFYLYPAKCESPPLPFPACGPRCLWWAYGEPTDGSQEESCYCDWRSEVILSSKSFLMFELEQISEHK